MNKNCKMSADLNKLLDKISFKTKKIMKPVIWISLTIGVNIKCQTGFKDPVKLISLGLLLVSIFNVATQYRFIWEHRFDSFTLYTDAVCTTFQIWISLSIMIHFCLTQHRFQTLLRKVLNSEILQNLEVLKLNISNKKQIMEEIQSILFNSWMDIKRQINIFVAAVLVILGWYYFSCLATNFYNTYVNPKEFEVLFPDQNSFPFWRNKGFQFPYYFILFLISGSGVHVSGFTAVSLTCLFIVNTLHALALLKILRLLIDNSTTKNVLPEERLNYILAWTRLYQRIYEFYYEINSLYYIQSAPLFLVSMLVICLLIFQGNVGLGTDKNMVIKMVFYLSAVVFQIFLFCYNGQRLTSESEKLSLDIYSTEWYEESNEFKLITRMMIMRTSRSFVLGVAGFTTMSRVTFLGIMRSSFSFFMLLREMNDK